MKQVLSSSVGTLVFKIFFPVFWVGGFGYGTAKLLLVDDPQKWSFLLAWILGTLIIVAICVSLKTVKIENDNIIISHYFKRVKVPISEISRVTENLFFNIHSVYIHFKNRTDFGNKIMFMPPPHLSIFELSGICPAQLNSGYAL
jgi:hypothetical protein